MKKLKIGAIINMIIFFLLIIGYCRNVYKFVTCNFEPVGKAEVLYGIGTFTGLGGIIGWFDIKDK
jgi:hypothetical protein